MSDGTKIEWCDYSFNPWLGCTKVSPGCLNCYAEGWSKRSGLVEWGSGQPRRRTSEPNWKKPRKWNQQAHLAYEQGSLHRPRVFCASLADWLDDEVPNQWRADLLRLIHETPYLDWLLLTKRPQYFDRLVTAAFMEAASGSITADNMMCDWVGNRGDRLSKPIRPQAPHNVWVGTTVEDQARADERIPALLQIPARIRFLSCEPLLEHVDLTTVRHGSDHDFPMIEFGDIHWVIAGGESGHRCRPFDPDWARSLRDQCASVGCAYFMKQMGGHRKPFAPIPDDLMIREFPSGKGVA